MLYNIKNKLVWGKYGHPFLDKKLIIVYFINDNLKILSDVSTISLKFNNQLY